MAEKAAKAEKKETKKPAEAAKKETAPKEAKAHKETKAKADDKPARSAKKKAAHAAGMKEHNCKIKGCKREYRAKGYCRMHYKKWRRGEYGIARYKTCKDMDCRRPMTTNRHGYCEEHFQSYYVKGVEVAKPAVPEKPAEKPASTSAAG